MEKGMKDTRERAFDYNGRTLTVRAAAFPEGWKVRIFDGDKPVTGIVYEVRHEVLIDSLTKEVPFDLVEHLMQIAEGDVTRGWVRVVP
jgi:hypothetical protein